MKDTTTEKKLEIKSHHQQGAMSHFTPEQYQHHMHVQQQSGNYTGESGNYIQNLEPYPLQGEATQRLQYVPTTNHLPLTQGNQPLPNQMSFVQAGLVNQVPSVQAGLANQMPSVQTGLANQMPSVQTGLSTQMLSGQTGLANQMPSVQSGLASHIMPASSVQAQKGMLQRQHYPASYTQQQNLYNPQGMLTMSSLNVSLPPKYTASMSTKICVPCTVTNSIFS